MGTFETNVRCDAIQMLVVGVSREHVCSALQITERNDLCSRKGSKTTFKEGAGKPPVINGIHNFVPAATGSSGPAPPYHSGLDPLNRTFCSIAPRHILKASSTK